MRWYEIVCPEPESAEDQVGIRQPSSVNSGTIVKPTVTTSQPVRAAPSSGDTSR
jgi:hypothetical protein